MKLLVTVWRFAAAMVAALVVLVVSLGLIGGIAAPSDARTLPPIAEPSVEPTPYPTATLTFAEECSDRLRPEWRALDNAGDPGYGLDSDFHGDLRQVTVADGICTITAERATTPSGRPFTSAAMSTNGTFAQLYGTFEIRVRYPDGHAMWPAFWLLKPGLAVQPPPEIDVFEAYPGKPAADGHGGSSIVFSTLHYARGSHSFVYDHGSNMTTDFHTHRLTWTPGLSGRKAADALVKQGYLLAEDAQPVTKRAADHWEYAHETKN